ncbi:GlxA family transcriptional regulator [Streptomyces sp. VRA16 Mangrove soil]|uniref:GlxA family transcriptional regulator n=1 Tax=Streptomyces sp. VRA16 Mangrove soil TaxID=2817434 RepID=UPI001A9DE0F6|nr:DJ-1/PfpI family protein [Streptomyces sp. VRA16 Mangrove soil]MBO1331348.1 DJ-1/PfpI family protein [Streptomyces sp. VRA16 Mangrove soil]
MEERVVVLVGYAEAELLDIACVTTGLTTANRIGASPAYAVSVATPGGRAITCDSGLTLQGQRSLERLRGPLDTLIISGGIGHEAAGDNPRIVGHVRRLARESRRVASVCTGATVLASAGLLNGRRATTHWLYAEQLAAAYPEITVDPAPIYIRDGSVVTAAGVTSALDLTLAFIEEDHGGELARAVARGLVTYLQRPGNQAQMSMFTATPAPTNGLVKRVVDHITSHLAEDLTATVLAAHAGVSERHLTRLFIDHLGKAPGRFVRDARTEAAAHLLTSTSLPVASVAAQCGFGTAETLRQAFASRYRTSPSRYRATQSTSVT